MTATKTIKQLNADARELLVAAKAIYDKGDDATPEELADAATKAADAGKIVEGLEKHKGDDALKAVNRIENSLAVLGQVSRPFLGGDGVAHGRDGRPAAIAAKTAGDLFVENEIYQGWLKSIAPNGNIPQAMQFQSPSVALKTLYTGAADRTASGPLLGQADRQGEVVRLGWAPLVLRQLVSVIPTGSDSVEVVREKTRTNNAASVAEATATGNGTGAAPESALDFEVITAAVKDIAHWVPATNNAVADANRLRAEIDAFLRSGIDDKAEALMCTGNESADATQFTGIYNTTGILTQAYDTSILKTSRKARTKIKVTGRATPTAYLMHPNDWEAIDLLQDAENRYYFGGPWVLGTPRLWGLPVVESEFATEGLALLGRFLDAVIYDREQTMISVGNQHADFFIRRIVAILGVMRAAFHVRRPKSFISVDLIA